MSSEKYKRPRCKNPFQQNLRQRRLWKPLDKIMISRYPNSVIATKIDVFLKKKNHFPIFQKSKTINAMYITQSKSLTLTDNNVYLISMTRWWSLDFLNSFMTCLHENPSTFHYPAAVSCELYTKKFLPRHTGLTISSVCKSPSQFSP